VSFNDALRDRLYNYFKESGHPEETARQISKDIAMLIDTSSSFYV